MICQYCKNPARFVDNAEIYGRRYGKSYMMWYCKPCDAYVGTHNNDPDKPLGELSNKELREWRKLAHGVIDSYWKDGTLKRQWVYMRMKNHFGEETHVGWSDVDLCKRIVEEMPGVLEMTKKEFEQLYLDPPLEKDGEIIEFERERTHYDRTR